MTLWMLWAGAVTTLVAGAAFVSERALRAGGFATRWPWVAVIAVVATLQVGSWVTPAQGDGSVDVEAFVITPSGTVPSPLPSAVDRVRQFIESGDVVAGTVWFTLSGLFFLVFVGGLLRLRVHMRSWEATTVDDQDVLVSPDFGPALVGVLRPRIVVPRWLLGLDREERRLALLHEAEHRRARDTTLLLAGSLAIALNPWNPALWWCVSRLRMAVEVDCDRRVLDSGVPAGRYGTLLIELSAAPNHRGLPVAALTLNTSLLERRLKMMTNIVTRTSPVRWVGAGGLAVLLVFAACEAPAPSMVAPDLDDTPTAALENGGTATFSEPSPSILISAPDGSGESTILFRANQVRPLIYIDGIRLAGGDITALDPEAIERIEVIKGDAALAQYGETAEGGVVQIFTKEARRGDPFLRGEPESEER